MPLNSLSEPYTLRVTIRRPPVDVLGRYVRQVALTLLILADTDAVHQTLRISLVRLVLQLG